MDEHGHTSASGAANQEEKSNDETHDEYHESGDVESGDLVGDKSVRVVLEDVIEIEVDRDESDKSDESDESDEHKSDESDESDESDGDESYGSDGSESSECCSSDGEQHSADVQEAWSRFLKNAPGRTVPFQSRAVQPGRQGKFVAVDEPMELQVGQILGVYEADMPPDEVYKMMTFIRDQIRANSQARMTMRSISRKPVSEGVCKNNEMHFYLACAHSIKSRGGNDKVADNGKGERALSRDTKRKAAEPEVRLLSNNRLESVKHSHKKKKKIHRHWVKNSRENTRSARTAECKAEIRVATVGYYGQERGTATRHERRKFNESLTGQNEGAWKSKEHREREKKCFIVTKMCDTHCGHDFQEDATRRTVTDEHYQLIRTILGGPPFKTLLANRARHILEAYAYPRDVAVAAVNRAKRAAKTLLTPVDMTPTEQVVTRMANDRDTRVIAIIQFEQKFLEKKGTRKKKKAGRKIGAKAQSQLEEAEPESAVTNMLVPASVADDETVVAEAIARNGTEEAMTGHGTLIERKVPLGKIVVVSDLGQTGLSVFLDSQDARALENMAKKGMDRYLANNDPYAIIALHESDQSATSGHGEAGAELEGAAAELASDTSLNVLIQKTLDDIQRDKFPESTARILTKMFFAKRAEIEQARRYPEVIQRDSTPNTNHEGYAMVMPTGIDGDLRSFTLGTAFMINETDINTSFVDKCLAAVTGCAENGLHYFQGNRSLWNDRNDSWKKSSQNNVRGIFGGPNFEPDHGYCSVHLHYLNFNDRCKASLSHYNDQHNLVYQWLHYRLGKSLLTKERWEEEWKNFLNWLQDEEKGPYPGETTATAQQARAEASTFFESLYNIKEHWAAPFMKRNGTLGNRDILRNENEHKLIKNKLAPSNIPRKEQPYSTVAVEEVARVVERTVKGEQKTKRLTSSVSSHALDQNEHALVRTAHELLNPKPARLMSNQVKLAQDLMVHWIDESTAVVWSVKFDKSTWIEKFNYGKYNNGNSVFKLLIDRTPGTMAPYPALCRVMSDGKLHCRKNDRDEKGCSFYQEFGLPCQHMLAANNFTADATSFPIRHTIAFAAGYLDAALQENGRNPNDMHLGLMLEPTAERKHDTVKSFADAMTATVEAWRQAMGIEPAESFAAERIDDEDVFESDPPSRFEMKQRNETPRRCQSDDDFFDELTPAAKAFMREVFQIMPNAENLARDKAAGDKFLEFLETYDGDCMRKSQETSQSRGGRPPRSGRKRTYSQKKGQKKGRKEKKSSKKGKKDKKRQRHATT